MRADRLVLGAGVLLLVVLISDRLCAQEMGATLSGTVTNATGRVVPNAKVSVKNVATGESREAATNSAGIYTVSNLVAGDYEVFVSADGRRRADVRPGTGRPPGRRPPATSSAPWKPWTWFWLLRRKLRGPVKSWQKICPMLLPASKRNPRCGISDSLQSKPREALRNRHVSINGRTC